MNFKIYAVGSSKSLSEEVKVAVEQLLSYTFPVEAIEVDTLFARTEGNFYVCNQSLYAEICKYVDEKKIAVLNLIPTSSFYLRIREIPSGADVYILNNRKAYCETLEKLCVSMELKDYHFVQVPFAETERDELKKILKNAEYVIGVKNIIDEFLQSPQFQGYLPGNSNIIKAQRVISVSSTGEIIAKLDRLLLNETRALLSMLDEQLQKLDDEHFLYEYYEEITQSLKQLQNRFYVISNETLSKDNIIIRSALNQLYD